LRNPHQIFNQPIWIDSWLTACFFLELLFAYDKSPDFVGHLTVPRAQLRELILEVFKRNNLILDSLDLPLLGVFGRFQDFESRSEGHFGPRVHAQSQGLLPQARTLDSIS